MWQQPLQAIKEDLLGYIIEYRRLLKSEAADDADEPNTVSEEEHAISVPLHRSKRSTAALVERNFAMKRFHLYFLSCSKKMDNKRSSNLLRKKRDVESDSDSFAVSEKAKNVWTSWSNLDGVPANETTYAVPHDKLHRDQIYEFQVLTVSKQAYSAPSDPISVSTGSEFMFHVIILDLTYWK